MVAPDGGHGVGRCPRLHDVKTRVLSLAGGTGVLLASLLVPVPTASAADRVVTVSDFSFSPDQVGLTLSSRIEFVFTDDNHSSTSDDGFWDTGEQPAESLERIWFPSSGTYDYHCVNHASMTGSVGVRPRATGSSDDGWKLRWADAEAPDDRTYDVQVRRKGADAWKSFRSDTTSRIGSFDPKRAGTWKVRARTSRDDGGTSRWSPVKRVSVS